MTPTPQDAGLIERLRTADHLHLATKLLCDEAADRLEALSQAATAEPEGWREIESAPMGADVLLYVPRRLGDTVAMGRNTTGTQWWARNIGDLKPTHWMPLPPAPQPDE